MTIVSIAVEHVIGITNKRVVGLHKVVTLRLLLTRLNLVNGTVF